MSRELAILTFPPHKALSEESLLVFIHTYVHTPSKSTNQTCHPSHVRHTKNDEQIGGLKVGKGISV